MNKLVVTISLAAMTALTSFAGALNGKIAAKYKVLGTDKFAGGERTKFDFNGYEAWVVEPPAGVKVANGCPWTWTMQWASAFVTRTPVPQLLKRGWHHATIITFQHRMDEKGLEISSKFQDFLVNELGLAPKACLIGMSWGGFFSTRYARYNPGRVAAIYYDAPLMNFAPGGYTNGQGDGPWRGRAKGDEWWTSPEMPINMAPYILEQQIPIYLLYGGVDAVVRPDHNCQVFERRYRRLGGENIRVSNRAAYAHHPHGLEESDPSIANFFVDYFYHQSSKPVTKFSVFAWAVRRVADQRKVDIAAAAKLLKDAGINGFDTQYTDKNIPEYIKAGLKPSNLYGWVKFDTPDHGEADAKAFIDTAVKYGVKRVMEIPDNYAKGADDKEKARLEASIIVGLKKMVAYGKQRGVLVMVEDFGSDQNICSFGPSMAKLLAADKELSYAVDSGNFYYSNRGTDVLEFAKTWSERIAHVHLKDLAKEDHHAYRTLGEGGVPNAELVKFVHSLGYRGWYTLENPVGDDILADLIRQRQYVIDAIRE